MRRVYLLGRSGPAQAAFTNPEIQELGELAVADMRVPEEVELDPLSHAALGKAPTRHGQESRSSRAMRCARRRQIQAPDHPLPGLACRADRIGGRSGDEAREKRLEANPQAASPRATGVFEEFPVGLVFRSVGYKGVALPDVPFHESWGVILNDKGRVLDAAQAVNGSYSAG